jgi:nucleoside-diphosphate-sugar epimerase/predicted alpha/beta hydrolase family esterase
MSSILLTGANGYVGARVLRVLVSHGHSVTAVVRSEVHAAHASAAGATNVLLKSFQELTAEDLSQVDAVVHTALDAAHAEASDRKLLAALANVQPAEKKPFLLYLSGLFVVGQSGDDVTEINEVSPLNTPDLLLWRAAIEREVLAAGGAVLRPGMVWGGYGSSALTWVETIRTSGAKHVTGPGGEFPFVHVNDLADLVEIVLRHRRAGVLHAVDGSPSLSYDALLRAFNAAAGASVPVLNVPLDEARKAMGGWADLFNLRFPLCSNTTALALGWTPAHTKPLAEIDLWARQNLHQPNVTITDIVLVPRWSGTTDDDWYPWFRAQLHAEHGDVRVHKVELAPTKDAPTVDGCVAAIDTTVTAAQLDVARTLFIGHSVGAQSVLRWIEQRANEPVGGALLVAAWFSIEKPWPAAAQWLVPFDIDKVRRLAPHIAVLLSTNDPYTPNFIETRDQFRDKLKAHVVFDTEAAHFNQSQAPSVLDVSKKFFL